MHTPNGARLLSSVSARILTGAAALLLAGCVAKTTVDQQTAGWSINRIYSEARDESQSGGYDRAVELYNVLEGRAAGTTLAQQAQLEKAYAGLAEQAAPAQRRGSGPRALRQGCF